MTLREFINHVSDNSWMAIVYLAAIPLIALWLGWIAKGKGNDSPWCMMYSALIYGIAVPAIFGISLTAYLFLFERKSIYDMDLIIQVLPVLSMILTIYIMKRNVKIDQIPGFTGIGGLILILFSLMALGWLLDRTNIFAISFIPFGWLILALILFPVLIWLGFRMMNRSKKESPTI